MLSVFKDNGTLSNVSLDYDFGGICPRGYYCEEGTEQPFKSPCPKGTYSNKLGLQKVSECEDCLPGLACSNTGLTAPNEVCSPGYYCTSKATTSQPSGGGTGGDICPAGYHCPNGSRTFSECDPGSFR